jgi:hypothetical protein
MATKKLSREAQAELWQATVGAAEIPSAERIEHCPQCGHSIRISDTHFPETYASLEDAYQPDEALSGAFLAEYECLKCGGFPRESYLVAPIADLKAVARAVALEARAEKAQTAKAWQKAGAAWPEGNTLDRARCNKRARECARKGR